MEVSARWIPRLLIATAILHIGAGLSSLNRIREVVDDGVVDSIEGRPERESAFWFLISGGILLTLGELARAMVIETGHLPMRLGASLLAIAVPSIALMPRSGWWLVAAIGGLAIRVSRRDSHVGAVAVPARRQ